MVKMKKTPSLQRSWLVQRLCPPRSTPNPFAFGGGIRNGGLTDEAMDLLSSIWSFDYMGAAEFEFGAVPKALQKMASLPLTRGTACDGLVYVLAPSDWLPEVTGRVEGWAAERFADLKEQPHLADALQGDDYRDVCGWLELDNGFAFFTDRPMFDAACRLFGVEVPNG